MEKKSEEAATNDGRYHLKFDSDVLERGIVAYLLQDPSTFLKLAPYLVRKGWQNNSYFRDSKLQCILNMTYGQLEKYKKLPTKNMVYTIIERLDADDYLKEKIRSTYDELRTQELQEDPTYFKDEIVKFIKKERAIEATYRCEAEIGEGNYEALSDIMREAVNVNLDKDLGISIKDVAQVLPMIQEVQDPEKGYTWGSPTLDMRIGRIQPGEIACFAGVPGAGKTAWLGHVGLENMKEGKKVILFSFEVNEKRISTRLYKAVFDANTNSILELDANTAYRVLNEEMSGGDFRIICRTANTFSSNDMAAVLRDLDSYYNWKPDLILVDYILITSTNDKRKDSSDTYKYYKTVSEELRNLAVEFKCGLVTACQINRGGMGEKGGSKGSLSAKDIAESKGVSDTVDYMIMIEQTADEKYREKDTEGNGIWGEYRLRVDKNRNGDSCFTAGFIINWKSLRISEKTR